MNKAILLSFDIEEFDIPEEYGQAVDQETKFAISRQGLIAILALLDKLNLTATFFITANFALHHQELVTQIASKHEIASHGFYHSDFRITDLQKSRETLAQLTHQPIIGFRMPRLQQVDEQEILAAGYQYNSSMNPTYLPGRYNNFFKPRTVYISHNLINLPVSVTPLIRFPLFWLSFKNLPLPLIKFASWLTLQHDSYLNLYFHPWEFTDIAQYQLPKYIKRSSGQAMSDRLENYLTWLQKQAQFIQISEFIHQQNVTTRR